MLLRSISPIMDSYEAWDHAGRNHSAGAFPTEVLRLIERMLPSRISASAETGCGKSTILFSNASEHHTVFCLDDRQESEHSSVEFFQSCPATRLDRLEMVYGPTQKTLPHYVHTRRYDLVMLDGPHGWPMPELEYYFFYPHIEIGGILILDDCNIPTIGRMADVLAEDAMWHLEGLAATAAIFRRTDAPVFDPFGDNWWEQHYNRRRVSKSRSLYLADRPTGDTISDLNLDANLFAGLLGEPDRPL
jgi:predicted O-methyltransferase YrrM